MVLITSDKTLSNKINPDTGSVFTDEERDEKIRELLDEVKRNNEDPHDFETIVKACWEALIHERTLAEAFKDLNLDIPRGLDVSLFEDFEDTKELADMACYQYTHLLVGEIYGRADLRSEETED